MLQLIVPNLHRRYTGVTATNRMVGPRLATIFSAAWCGSHAPEGIVQIGFNGILACRSQRAPIIWHARRNDEMLIGLLLKTLGWPLKMVFTSAAQRRHTSLTTWLIGQMDAVIATSDLSASYLKRQATVILHGVDTDKYSPANDREAAVGETSLAGFHLIGCFGRVRPQKGTDLFVDAMCRLLPKYPDFAAVVVGAATPDQVEFADTLKAKIDAAGLRSRILMTGELPPDELPLWFQRLTIYAFTSRNEGFGLTLIEAMSSGSAVVAARAGAAEVVVRDGIDGILVAPNDVDGLVAGLEVLTLNPSIAIAMGADARDNILQNFSIDREIESISNVYRTLL